MWILKSHLLVGSYLDPWKLAYEGKIHPVEQWRRDLQNAMSESGENFFEGITKTQSEFLALNMSVNVMAMNLGPI